MNGKPKNVKTGKPRAGQEEIGVLTHLAWGGLHEKGTGSDTAAFLDGTR